MDWIKRNLFFFVGTVVAVGLLAAAGVYGMGSWQRNETALNSLNEAYKTLQALNHENPSPGNDKVDNIKAAREQERELREWIQRTKQSFQPIPPIPSPTNGVVINEKAFTAALRRAIDQLQQDAEGAGVTVPPQYNFSFQAQRNRTSFTPGDLDSLAHQLGGVREICDVLFSARINSLDGLRRVRVSDDDARGPQSDYLDGAIVTNNLAVFTPYEVTFRCFSQDLANALVGFASSPHGFIVKDINVQQATAAASSTSPFGGETMGSQPPPYGVRQPTRPSPPAGVSQGGLRTVLDEQLLSVTMKVVAVKLLPEI